MRFLVSATDRRGRRVTERVEAESGDAAVAELRGRGLEDVRLETDSLAGAVDATVGEKQRREKEKLLSAAAEASMFRQSGLVFQIRTLYRGTWFLWLPALAWLVWRRAAAQPPGFLDLLLLALLFGQLPLAVWAERRVSRYDKMLAAVAMCRWQEVLDRLPGVEDLLRSSGGGFAEHEASVRRAEALAGLGRMDEAEAVMERLRGLEVVPEPVFWLRFATVHEAARDFDAVERCYRKAVELAPEDPTARLSLGEFLARRRRDPDGAEAELAAARRHELAATTTWAVHRLEATIALERGDARRAREGFERSIAEVSQLTSGLARFCVLDLCAYLALALAQLGEREKARRCFAPAEALLAANRETELIERCRAALGLTGS